MKKNKTMTAIKRMCNSILSVVLYGYMQIWNIYSSNFLPVHSIFFLAMPMFIFVSIQELLFQGTFQLRV